MKDKKPQSKKTKYNQSKYLPKFIRIDVDDKVGKSINKYQSKFEKIKQELFNDLGECIEVNQAIMRMQEACFWITRSLCVVSHNKLQEQAQKKEEPKEHVSRETLPEKPQPKIVVRKSKLSLKAEAETNGNKL